MATKYSYEALGPGYQKLWDTMHIIRDDKELGRLSDKLKANKAPYQAVQDEIGVPWQMVAVIHVREAGETDIGQWKRCLHNGERIIGTGRKTKLVPAGRGPFSTWHAAAIDALKQKGFDKIKSWPVSRVLWGLEPYNGYGYRNKGLNSPYLWASTNHQQRGKYVADGVFDPSVMDTQIGCAALLKYLEFPMSVTKPIVVTKTVPSATSTTAGTIAAGAAATVIAYPHSDWVTYGAYGIGALAVGVCAYEIYKHFKGKTTNVG